MVIIVIYVILKCRSFSMNNYYGGGLDLMLYYGRISLAAVHSIAVVTVPSY